VIEEPPSSVAANWQSALLKLLSSRVAIISCEGKDTLVSLRDKSLPLLVGVCALLVAWIMAMAAAVGFLADVLVWKWFQAAFATAAFHFLVALLAFAIARSKKITGFPVTSSEFKKDSEWLNQLTTRHD